MAMAARFDGDISLIDDENFAMAPDFFMAEEKAMMPAMRATRRIVSGLNISPTTRPDIAPKPIPRHRERSIPPAAAARPI